MNVVKNQPFFLSGFPIVIFRLETRNQRYARLSIQKADSYTGHYKDMYLCDNEMQLLTAMEDYDYTLLVRSRWCSLLCKRCRIKVKIISM